MVTFESLRSLPPRQPISGGARCGRGFTLIEVLIALLVLTIGLVGMAALHLTSIQSAHSSYYRSVASSVALDFEERMWQRGAEVLDSPGECLTAADLDAVSSDIVAQWSIAVGNEPETGPNRVGIPNLNVAMGDIRPGSRTRNASDGGTWADRWIDLTLTLTWTETRFAADNATVERFDYATRMPCVSEFTPP